ncbi:TetR/AcrR family transcriptional regulator [Rugosimonospora acidiphila]|uniref:TetR/AcrR family transcriptional regulator n=1 Tax=Rugosimonospora acidiphila TaxID=556531 RepID=UPI0031EFDD1F
MDLNSGPARRAGRTRDTSIDLRVLAAARRQLSRDGYEAMSVASVAEEAGTTRQAIYRRWPTKADLAAAVVATIDDDVAAETAQADPFAALVAELTDFARGVSMPGRMSLVGAMLQESADPAVVTRYRAHVIAPRRARLTAIFHDAQRLGLIDPDADFTVAVTMCTGNWYGRALAGDDPPPDWPVRAATLVWRSVGGDPPPFTMPD